MSQIVCTIGATPPQWQMVFGRATIIFYGSRLKLGTTLPDDQEIPFVGPTTGTDSKGNSVPLKGAIAVTVSDPKILEIVQPDPTTPTVPNSGVIRAVGIGSAQVVFTDTGDGSAPLTVIVEVEVIAGAIVSINPPILGNLRPASPG